MLRVTTESPPYFFAIRFVLFFSLSVLAVVVVAVFVIVTESIISMFCVLLSKCARVQDVSKTLSDRVHNQYQYTTTTNTNTNLKCKLNNQVRKKNVAITTYDCGKRVNIIVKILEMNAYFCGQCHQKALWSNINFNRC